MGKKSLRNDEKLLYYVTSKTWKQKEVERETDHPKCFRDAGNNDVSFQAALDQKDPLISDFFPGALYPLHLPCQPSCGLGVRCGVLSS